MLLLCGASQWSMLSEGPGVTPALLRAAAGPGNPSCAPPVRLGALPQLSVTLVDGTCLKAIMSISM